MATRVDEGGIVGDWPEVLFMWRVGEPAKVERVRSVWKVDCCLVWMGVKGCGDRTGEEVR